MARVSWHGQTFNAVPLEQLANGDWLMEAREHGARFTVGTKIVVTTKQIVSMDAAEMPAPAESATALQSAMDAERETLPTVAELLAKRNDPPPAPTAPSPAPDTTDMPSKLAQLAALAATTNTEIEAQADKSLNRLTAARAKAQDGLGKLDGLTAEIEAGTAAIEDMANQLTNGAPSLGKS
jgi:hypothetical protein